MAARVLFRRRAAAPLMAASLVGGALLPSVALAEAPPAGLSSRKKPIYDDNEGPLPKHNSPTPSGFSDTIPTRSEPPPSPAAAAAAESQQAASSSPLQSAAAAVLPGAAERPQHPPRGPTPTDRLAVQIGQARMWLYRHATTAEDAVNATMDRAFDLEKSFTQTVASLAPPRESGEKLMPGLVYVLVAGMAGSIVSRNRGFLLRASVPLALGVGAGWLVIPVTMTNVSDLLWKYEQRFPVVAQAHLQARSNLQKSWQQAMVQSDSSKEYLEQKVAEARGKVESWVKQGK